MPKIISEQTSSTFPKLSEQHLLAISAAGSLSHMPIEVVKELGAFVVEKDKKKVKLAALNPSHPTLRQFVLQRFTDHEVAWYVASKEQLNHFLKTNQPDLAGQIINLVEGAVDPSQNMVEIVNLILAYAFAEKASDIHIEPAKGETAVRFRIDGMLRKVLSFPVNLQQALIARLKILANLRIDEYRRPQDGRIDPEGLNNVSLRVSTVPTLHGEKAALRILDESQHNFSITDLGFSAEQKEILLRNMEKPFGMIVTSGPTGSGKTTTLYALLSMLSKDDANISTLEDPIERSLPGVNQIQINPRVELTYASGLRSLLRQDPDVIMVGEVRDSETAVMSANAALTGHLVLTTLHTNDAPSAFTRFLEMKVEDFLVATMVNLVIAQRLVRKVCANCATVKPLDDTVLKKIKQRADVWQILKNKYKFTPVALAKKSFAVGRGCVECLHTGYSGRLGLFEMLELDKQLHDLLLNHASSEEIKQHAQSQGFKEMIEDGVDKVLQGATTFDEVLRVTRNT
jgi:general secretion pathway protein E